MSTGPDAVVLNREVNPMVVSSADSAGASMSNNKIRALQGVRKLTPLAAEVKIQYSYTPPLYHLIININ